MTATPELSSAGASVARKTIGPAASCAMSLRRHVAT